MIIDSLYNEETTEGHFWKQQLAVCRVPYQSMLMKSWPEVKSVVEKDAGMKRKTIQELGRASQGVVESMR